MSHIIPAALADFAKTSRSICVHVQGFYCYSPCLMISFAILCVGNQTDGTSSDCEFCSGGS